MFKVSGRKCVSNQHIVCVHCIGFQKDAIDKMRDLYESSQKFSEIECDNEGCGKSFKLYKFEEIETRFFTDFSEADLCASL